MTKKYLIDTNILFNTPEVLEKYDCVITSHVLREVEHLELTRKQDRQLQFQIRRFKRLLDANEHIHVDLKDYTFNLREDWDGQYTDNILVQICVEEGYGLLSNDKLLKDKCRLYGVEVVELDESSDYVEHKGFKEVSLSETEHINIFDNVEVNHFDLITNEYCIINNVVDGELLDVIRWDGAKIESLVNSKGKLGEEVRSDRFEKITAKDEYQAMAIDSILKNQVTSIRGRAGSGKSLIALYTSWQLVEKEGYKLVVFVNPVNAKDSQELGFYKGDRLTKLLQSSVGATLISKFGDEDSIKDLIEANYLEILPFANMRGYDTGDTKTIVWILESQNLTSELLKLGLQRIGENTKVIIDGDFHLQIDANAYESDNGMKRMSEVLRGIDLYGEIELQNVYRSRLASLVDAM